MDLNQVREYIKKYKNEYSYLEIEKQLKNMGYDEKDIKSIYDELNSDKLSKNTNSTNYKYAGFWIRALALFLDGLIVAFPLSFLFTYISIILNVNLNSLGTILFIVYVIYFEGIKGGTLGKMIVGIKIIDKDGKTIGIGGAILRYIGKILSGIFLGAGYILAAFDDKKQALHDKIVKSYVVYKN